MINRQNYPRKQRPDTKLNPGDEAQLGTPGTGEDICPQCHGTGRVDRVPCPNCGGRGTVVKGIAGG